LLIINLYISLLCGVELVACDDSAKQSTEANLAIVEIEAEPVLGNGEGLSGGDGITKVLEEVEGVIEPSLRDLCSSILEACLDAFICRRSCGADFGVEECLLLRYL
jgi:hypothetical protein